MVIKVKAKQWGHSIGLIIPKETIDNLKIKPGEDLMIQVERKKNPLKELFGTLKSKKSTEQMIKEVRKELGSKWM